MAITLNANEIYSALSNMILSSEVFTIQVAEPTLANKLRREASKFGDTLLFTSLDIGKSVDFLTNRTNSDLLGDYTNDSQYVDKVIIDQFRRTAVTIEEWLTPRAWMAADSFQQFQNVLTSTLSQVKKVYDNGLVNTSVGTHVSIATAANKTVSVGATLGDTPTPSDVEAFNRLTGQAISKLLKDVYTELRDNRRDYNELGYMRAYSPEELLIVWNAQAKSKITDIDLPTVFHKGEIMPIDGIDIDQHYFGTIYANTGTAKAGDYSLIEADYSVTNADESVTVTHVFPGEAIPVGATYAKDVAYAIDPKVVCKLISAKGVPFMSSIENGGAFYNVSNGTTNHFLIWGFSTLKFLKDKPFVTIKLP